MQNTRKIGRWLCCYLLLLWMLTGMCTAVDASVAEQAISATEEVNQILTILPEDAAQLLEGADLTSPTGFLAQLCENMAQSVQDSWLSGLRTLGKVLVVGVLCGIFAGFGTDIESDLPVIQMTGALGMAAVIFTDVSSLLALCEDTAMQLSAFATGMLPIMATAVATAGAPTTAATLQVVTLFAFDLLIRLLLCVLLPAVRIYLAMVTLNTALGNDLLGSMAGLIHWAVSGVLKISLTVFTTYLAISGVMSGSADAVAVKTAKFAVSGVVPVVGGIISDAAESLLAGAALVRGTVGVVGMVGVLVICLLPFVQVGCNYLTFKIGSAVIAPICGSPLAKMMAQCSQAFGLLLGMLGTCAMVIFMELVFSMMLTNSI